MWFPQTIPPTHSRIVVGLRPLTFGTTTPVWETVLVQFMNDRWSYAGSDQKCRDLQYWHDLSPLPKELPR